MAAIAEYYSSKGVLISGHRQQERSESREDAQDQQESMEKLKDSTRKSTITALLTTGLNIGQNSNPATSYRRLPADFDGGGSMGR